MEKIEYPKMLYCDDGAVTVVVSHAEHLALEGRWAESPAGPFPEAAAKAKKPPAKGD